MSNSTMGVAGRMVANTDTEYGAIAHRSRPRMPGLVHNWMGDRLGLPGDVYTRTCVQRCRVVGLREPRKSDDSSD